MERDGFTYLDSSFISSSFSAFRDMKKTGELVDFKVTIQTRCFFAHRVVLAAGIPYLRTMFASSGDEISLETIDPEVFEDIINFAYCGEIQIHGGNVQSLLIASQVLQLAKVHNACIKYMAMRINLSNVFSLRLFAGNIQSLKLAITCDHFILRNFEEFQFSQHNEFLQLPFPYLKEIISRDDLNVRNEETLFEAIVKWVKASPQERCVSFPEVLNAVRLTYVATDYLVDKIASEALVASSLPCRNLVEATKNYHLSFQKRSSSVGLLNMNPRNTRGHGLYAICSSALGNFIEMYDMENEMWITLSPVDGIQFDHVVGYDGKLYIFASDGANIDSFDVRTLKRESFLKSKSHVSSANSFQQIILHENKFYGFQRDKMFSFTLILKEWQLKYFVECNNSGIASLGQFIYITGGYISGNSTASCKRYNTGLGKESKISPMLSSRGNHCCTGLNDRLYVCDSMKGEIYNPVADQWSSIAGYMESFKWQLFVSAYQGKLYAFTTEQTEIYDPQNNTWTLGVPVPSPCRFTKYVIIPPT